MLKQKIALLWGGAVTFGVAAGLLLASCVSAPLRLNSDSPLGITINSPAAANSAVLGMRFEKLYDSHSFEEMTDLADGIAVGKVTAISPVQWNQDSGEFWADQPGDEIPAFPIRDVTVEVIEPIVAFDGMDESLTITTMTDVVELDENNKVLNQGEMTQGLAVGDEVVIFVRQTELAWRDGLHPATMLMGTPTQSYFKLGDDGLYHGELLPDALPLEALIQRIREERASPTPAPAFRELRFDRQYDLLSFEEMTDLADGIVVGKVTAISPVQWNQDSGEFWADDTSAFPVRYVTVEVIEPIVGFDGMGESLTITTFPDIVFLDENNHSMNELDTVELLGVGDEVVIFVGQTELAWRDGIRPATILLGTPSQSYFKLGGDGLYYVYLLNEWFNSEDLIQKILEERASPAAQP